MVDQKRKRKYMEIEPKAVSLFTWLQDTNVYKTQLQKV